MKTANELLMSHRNSNSYKLNLRELTDALAEHDKEIKELIDEMIVGAKKAVEDYLWEKDVTDKNEEKILRAVGNSRITALTELKEKL